MPAQHKIRRRRRTDWFRVLVQMQYAGWSNDRVTASIGVARGTLRGWKDGAEPAHAEGHRLLLLWTAVTNQTYDQRPMTD